MSLFDIILLCIIGGFALFGLWFGFIHTLGSLLGTVIGVFLASRYYELLADWLANFGWAGNMPKATVFILAFIIINRLVGLVFWFVEKTVGLITRLPFISSINRILGFALGLFEGLITIGMALYAFKKFPISPDMASAMEASFVAPYALGVAAILLPLLPDAWSAIKDGVSSVETWISTKN